MKHLYIPVFTVSKSDKNVHEIDYHTFHINQIAKINKSVYCNYTSLTSSLPESCNVAFASSQPKTALFTTSSFINV